VLPRGWHCITFSPSVCLLHRILCLVMCGAGLNSSVRAGDPTEGCPDIGCECTCLPPSPSSLRLARGAAAKRAPGSCLARLTEPDLLLHPTAIAISHLHPSFLYPLHLRPLYLQSSGDGGLHSTCVSARSLRYWGSQSPRVKKTGSHASSFIHPPACSSSTGCGLLLLEPDRSLCSSGGVVALVEGKGQWGFSWCVWGVADYKYQATSATRRFPLLRLPHCCDNE
jgi:hypothetical protein